jgi:hypothetical protein
MAVASALQSFDDGLKIGQTKLDFVETEEER